MRIPLITITIVVVVALLVDIYLYVNLRRRCKNRWGARLQLITALAFYAALIVGVALPYRSGSDAALHWTMRLVTLFMIQMGCKLVFTICDLIGAIPLLMHRRHRWRGWTIAGWVLSIATLVLILWGIFINRFRTAVEEVTVEIPGLPSAFDGFRIVQISDFHVGTYESDTTFVAEVVREINTLDADIILFTGDIVNRNSSELKPFLPILARVHAPMGVYTILGNHDYGDYEAWPTLEAKLADREQLYHYYDSIGWHLLRNSSVDINLGQDKIALIGVENIGDPPFHIYGDLGASYPTLNDSIHKILLTHNPVHWSDDIAGNPDVNIDLTLSGHTHAMQIELFGLSPAALRYDCWGGLYADSLGRQIYVNRGLGAVGIPMRIGATPEITVLTLKSNP